MRLLIFSLVMALLGQLVAGGLLPGVLHASPPNEEGAVTPTDSGAVEGDQNHQADSFGGYSSHEHFDHNELAQGETSDHSECCDFDCECLPGGCSTLSQILNALPGSDKGRSRELAAYSDALLSPASIPLHRPPIYA